MLKSIGLGILLTFVTVGIHAAGTTWWIEQLRRQVPKLRNFRRVWPLQFRLLGSTAVALLLLHIVEVVCWALAYLWIGQAEIASFEEATYFSTVTFTSLGYGDVVIKGPWRLLAAIESMVGLLIFGWSTATLFAVVQRISDAKSNRQPETRLTE